VLFFCLNIYSQNLSLLFKNDLPKDINKYFTEESVNDILIQDAELNPELIFWRINILRELIENRNTDNDKIGLNYLNKLRNQNQLEKNNFLEESKLRAGKEVSDRFRKKINDVLDEYIINYPPVSRQNDYVPDYDTHKLYYIAVKYICGKQELSYNKEERYEEKVKENEIKKVLELKQKLSEMKVEQGKITIEYLEYLIKDWWLVKTDTGICDDLASATREYIDEKYSTRKIKRIDITAGFAYTLNDLWYSYDVIYPFIYNGDQLLNNTMSQLSETKNYPSFVIQGGYKLLLKDFNSFLSYIDIGIGFSAANLPSFNPNDFSYNQQYNVINVVNYSSLSFSADNIRISKQIYFSLNGKISVPIFMVTPEIIVQAGILGGINYYSADVSYNYTFINTVYTYNWRDGNKIKYLQNDVNIPRNESISRHIFNITPIAELNFKLSGNMLVKFTTSGYNYFNINAGVEF